MGRLTGERRALCAAVLAFYGFLFLITTLTAPPEWTAAFAGLALVYGIAFFSLVAGYFWARWYSIGVGMFGLITAVFSIVQVGLEPVFMFFGGTHAFVSLALWGSGMASVFDGRKEWRERFHLDENATHRLGKAIIRLGLSLPYVIIYALAPKEGAGELLLAAIAGAVAVSGVVGMIRMRGWGLVALAAGAGLVGASLAGMSCGSEIVAFGSGSGYGVNVQAVGIAAVIAMVAALAPLARPVARYLRG